MFSYFWVAPMQESSCKAEELQRERPQPKHQPEAKSNTLKAKYQDLKANYEKLKKENVELKNYIEELENCYKPDQKKKKIKRRKEDQLVKEHKCPYLTCKKEYASSFALNLHIKNKHKGGTKKERTALFKQIIKAEINGDTPPEIPPNIPAQLIEEQIKALRAKIMKGVTLDEEDDAESSPKHEQSCSQ